MAWDFGFDPWPPARASGSPHGNAIGRDEDCWDTGGGVLYMEGMDGQGRRVRIVGPTL